MNYEIFNEYVEQLSDAEYIFDDSEIFDLVFNTEHDMPISFYNGVFKHYAERFGEGEAAAAKTLADILDKLLPHEVYRVYFGYDFFKNDIFVRYRMGRSSLITMLAHFFNELDVCITDDKKSGFILINMEKDYLMSSVKSEDIPVDVLRSGVMTMTDSE